MDFFRVVLTGGPCGGKTTAQSLLSDMFENMGWKVYRVNEAATHLLTGGVNFALLTPSEAYEFQKSILQVMMRTEETFVQLAESHAKRGIKTMIIYDRGAMDVSAYMDKADWHRMLEELNLTEVELRDGRYDCVVHLVTAANGASEFYTLDNNAARKEGIEAAIQVDSKVSDAWMGHPYFNIIDNGGIGFDQKIDRLLQCVLNRMGLVDVRRQAQHRKFKFLLSSSAPSIDFPVKFRDFHVEHRFLKNDSDQLMQVKIRKRGWDGSFTYTSSTTVQVQNQVLETRRNITQREYESLLLHVDDDCVPVIKNRRNFIFNNRYYQIDSFVSPCSGMQLLEAHLSSSDEIPPFLSVLKQVTQDPAYSLYEISKRKEEKEEQE